MKKIAVVIMLITATLIFAQSNKNNKKTTTKKTVSSKESAKAKNSKSDITSTKPSQAKNSDLFEVKQVSFNKGIDPYGQGEVLEVQFQLSNNTDMEYDLYIFVIATIEEITWRYNSFTLEDPDNMLDDSKEKMNKLGGVKLKLKESIVHYLKSDPDDKKQFEYDIDGKTKIIKLPKDYTKGVNVNTGKPYHLKNTLEYNNRFLSEYRRGFKYFDHVTVLIYDAESEEMIFRQIWSLDGRRK